MQFNSSNFLYFFGVVYALYWLLRRQLKLQSLLLVCASYFFFGFENWRWIFLILLTTGMDYLVGMLLGKFPDSTPTNARLRKALLGFSIFGNLAILGVFKYFNFFSESLVEALNFLHLQVDAPLINLVAPLGISFWTLKSLSYTLDVYHRRVKPVTGFLDYAVFVSFFPTLLAGPIDRARQFLPQVARPRDLAPEKLTLGLHLILVGYFKKLVIADNLAMRIVDPVFTNYLEYAGVDVLLAGLAFTFQLYADFSGYTDIARGVALLLGFETAVNFRMPYFAVNPSDFWQRWHISFSEWLRDYVFFPLRRNLLSSGKAASWITLVVPPLVTMLLCGLWHGANWNYVIWGGYQGILLILNQVLKIKPSQQGAQSRWHAYLLTVVQWIGMFTLTVLGWIIFRSTTPGQAMYMLGQVSGSTSAGSLEFLRHVVFYTAPLWVVELVQHARKDPLLLTRLPLAGRILLNGVILTAIVLLGGRAASEFIYVQF